MYDSYDSSINKKVKLLPLILAGIPLSACGNQALASETLVITRIAFGSRARQDKEQPLLRVAADLKPDVFIFLGDNIYGDSRNMATLRAKYARLAAKEEFQALCHLQRHHRDLGCDRAQ